jgi:hypothetical protein
METADLLRSAEALGPTIAETKKLQKQVRWIRFGFVVLVMAIILGWTLSIINHFRKFDTDRFATEMSKKAEAMWPMISNELDTLLKNVMPAAEKTLDQEIEKAAPEIGEKLGAEAKQLETGMKSEIDAAVRRYLTAEGRAGAITELQAAFPALGDAGSVDKLTAALQESFILAAQQQLTDTIVAYYDTMMGFDKAFKKIRADIPDNQKPPTLETVLALWIEVVYEKMGGDENLVPKADAKAAKAKK